jgi:hypothetical protein
MCKAQECERFRLCFTTHFRSWAANHPNSISRVFSVGFDRAGTHTTSRGRKLTPEKATQLRPRADGCRLVEAPASTPLIGERGPVTLLDTFEGRRLSRSLFLHVADRQTGAGAVRGLHLGYFAGARAVLYSCSRHHLRHVLPRPVRRERRLSRVHGLGDTLVFGAGLSRDSFGWDGGLARCTSLARIRCNSRLELTTNQNIIFKPSWMARGPPDPSTGLELTTSGVYG